MRHSRMVDLGFIDCDTNTILSILVLRLEYSAKLPFQSDALQPSVDIMCSTESRCYGYNFEAKQQNTAASVQHLTCKQTLARDLL